MHMTIISTQTVIFLTEQDLNQEPGSDHHQIWGVQKLDVNL